VTGEGVADLLDVLLDDGELAFLVLHHRPQVVVEDALDVGDIALQRVDSGGMLVGGYGRDYA
jgi:hypothetical protein